MHLSIVYIMDGTSGGLRIEPLFLNYSREESLRSKGHLIGGPQCRVSNLRNGNVPCRYLCISHVNFFK